MSGFIPVGGGGASVDGVTISGTPTTSQTVVATSGTTATWQTVASGNVFTYQQGGVAAGNVYTTFLAAYTAAFALGTKCYLIVDDTLSLNAAVTGSAGALDLHNITIVGVSVGNTATKLTWQTGTTCATNAKFQNINNYTTSTAVVFGLGTGVGVGNLFVELDHSFINMTSAVADFMHASNPSSGFNIWNLYLKNTSKLTGSAGFRCASADTTAGYIEVLIEDDSGYTATTFGGTGEVDVLVSSSAAGAGTACPTTQANVSGTFTFAINALASQTKYTDSAPTIGSTTVQGVIDILKVAGGDLAGTYPNPTVVSLTGSSGAINIASTGNILTWNSATTAPGLKQANTAVNSATGATTTIQAQNATGTTTLGGNLVLQSGTGTSTDGYLQLFSGSTQVANLGHNSSLDYIKIGASPATTGNLRLSQTSNIVINDGGSNLAVFTGAAGTMTFGNSTTTDTYLTSGGYTLVTGASGVELCAGTVYFCNTGGTSAMSWAPTPAGSNTINFTASNTSLTIKQLDKTTNSGTGAPITIQAQNETGTTSIGGALILAAGTGTSHGGTINITSGYTIQNITVTSTTYAVDGYSTTSDYVIFTDSSSNTITITLPVPTSGRRLIIKDKTGKVTTHAVVVQQHASETIDGATSVTFTKNYDCLILVSDGVNWSICGEFSSTIVI